MASVTQSSKISKRQALKLIDEETVALTATVTSDGFTLPHARSIHGIWVRATSASGTPSISVFAEFAPEDTAALYARVEGAAANLTITDENPHVTELLWIAAPWGRIKVTGGALNPADTVVTVFILHD